MDKENNVFIDIGAHTGESLEEAIRGFYNFNSLHAIEPSSFGVQKIKKIKSKKIRIHKIGVADYRGSAVLYGSGAVGASLFQDKTQLWKRSESVNIVKFSDWLNNNIPDGSSCYLKINAEGSEYAILKEILNSPKQTLIKSILLSVDIYKVPSLKNIHAEFEEFLKQYPIHIRIRNEKEIHLAIANWLQAEMVVGKNISLIEFLKDRLRPELPLTRNIRRMLKPILPVKIWIYFALRFGPNRPRN
jgi:FkbM family methyltransferase